MDFNFFEYFYNNKYDDRVILKKNGSDYTVADIKKFVGAQVDYYDENNISKVSIKTEDCFDFIINFLSCVLSGKTILIANNNNKTKVPEGFCEISEVLPPSSCARVFEARDLNDIKIMFYTSGTTSEPKIIEKTPICVLNECRDFAKVSGDICDKNIEFVTSASINHLYAMTFYIFFPLFSRNIINTDKVNYPEDLTDGNRVFITTPSFLKCLSKNPDTTRFPRLIISAGAVLPEDVQAYFEKNSSVLNIYGSTETGIIAYKQKHDEPFKLFDGVKIIPSTSENTRIYTDYGIPSQTDLCDKIEVNADGTIEFLSRNDRIFKIREKRVCANEPEEEIKKNIYVRDCLLVKTEDKLGALVALNNKGYEFWKTNGLVELIRELKRELTGKFSIIPQKWKFIDEIPTNKMGKPDMIKIREIFALNLSLPLVLRRETGNACAEIDLYFFKNCNFFKGHFDGFPIVPGVVQLFYASYFAEIVFGKKCCVGQIRRIKFSNIIHPDTVITLKLNLKENCINYEYCDENMSYSGGSLPLENVLKEVRCPGINPQN